MKKTWPIAWRKNKEMRYFLLCLLLVIQSANGAGAQVASKSKSKATVSKELPRFQLVYLKDGPFERECSGSLNKPIKVADADEIDRRLKEFQSIWDQWGDKYMQWTIDEFHIPFPHRELRVTLTACEFPSMSTPFPWCTMRQLRNWWAHGVSTRVQLMEVKWMWRNDNDINRTDFISGSPSGRTAFF